MKIENIQMNEIRKIGLEALNSALGPIGTIRFIQQFDTGYGDYSKEKHEWIDKYDVKFIFDDIKANR